MENNEIINILNNIAVLLELKGENPFKSKAYSNAAEIIENENIDIFIAVKNNTLKDIKGFGSALVSKITDYVENGKMEYYMKLTSEVPESLIPMTKLSNLGTKKVRQLWLEQNITTMEELEKACNENLLQKIKGFGQKTVEMILNGIKHKKAAKGRHRQENAKKEADEILGFLKNLPSVKNVEITGDVRRFTEIITKFHYLIATNNNDETVSCILERYTEITGSDIESFGLNLEFSDSSKTYVLSKTSQNIPVIFELVSPDEFPVALHTTTGNDEYLSAFNKLLDDSNCSFEAYRLIDSGVNKVPEDEQEIYRHLKIQFVPPELRESAYALQLAKEKKIPHLIEATDLQGMIHVHSTWSDGHNSIKEMALSSKELGFSYIVMCDHSQSAVYANGLKPDRVKLQHEEIDQLNTEELGIKIIKGIESDILPDGSLDYEESTLKEFEFIVASVHSSFRMTKSEMTKRIINALKNPYTKMLGHPTGRLLLVRQEYELDIKEIIDCASDYGKSIEINSNPYRLDLSWENVIYAKEKGVKIAINPDSHRTSSLTDVFIGIGVAKKGWLESKDVVNCLGYEEFKTHFCNLTSGF